MEKLSFIRRNVEELKEKTWELDTNTRNNLVFYGIKEEGNPGNTEWAVREVTLCTMALCPNNTNL